MAGALSACWDCSASLWFVQSFHAALRQNFDRPYHIAMGRAEILVRSGLTKCKAECLPCINHGTVESTVIASYCVCTRIVLISSVGIQPYNGFSFLSCVFCRIAEPLYHYQIVDYFKDVSLRVCNRTALPSYEHRVGS